MKEDRVSILSRAYLAIVGTFAVALTLGCAGAAGGGTMGGGFSASAKVSVSGEIGLPIPELPPKYASWAVEAEAYLEAVKILHDKHIQAKADLAAALGVEPNADAIAAFIRDAIQVETTLVCQPPSFEASFVADCRAEAAARGSGNVGDGQAHSTAVAGIDAICQAKGSWSFTPGSCQLQTTVTEHPILSDAAKWARVQAGMKVVLQLSVANGYLDGRGADINSRGMRLHVESVTDLGKDPALLTRMEDIRAKLKRGAEAAGQANQKQGVVNGELGTMTRAIDDQFPGIRASVNRT